MKKILFIQTIFFAFLSSTSFAQSLAWAQGFNPAEIGNFSLDKSNKICVVGGFSGTIDLDQGPSVYNVTSVGVGDWFLLREDAGGNFQWAKHFDGSLNPNAYLGCHGIANDSNGSIFLYGSFVGNYDFDPGTGTFFMSTPSSPTINYVNTYLLKLDSTGNFIWAKQFTGSSGGIGDRDMKLDSSGNIYLMSAFGGTIDVDPGPNVVNMTSVATNAMLIEKLDNNGNYQWAKQIGNAGGMSLAIDSLNNLYIAGAFTNTADFDPGSAVYNLSSIAGSNDIFIEKLDSAANFIWVKAIGGSSADIPQSVTVDNFGNILSTGYYGGNVDFDPGPFVHILTGSTINCFILKLNANGDYVWAVSNGTEGRSVTLDAMGNVYTTGEFSGGDFDPGTGVYTLFSQGSEDVFVQKLDSSGNFIWAEGFGSIAHDIPGLIRLDHSNNIIISGVIGVGGQGGPGDFDPGLGIKTLGGLDAGFIEKLCITPPPINITVLNDTICVGDTAYLSVDAIQGATYVWGKDGNPIANSNHDSLKVTQSGSYIVGIYGVGCPYGSDTVHVYVSPVHHPTIGIYAPTSVQIGQQATVSANLTGVNAPYLIHWYINGQVFTTNSSSLSYTKTLGIDTIHASLVVQAPCYDTTVSGYWYIHSTNGIESINHPNQLLIFPNPATNTLYIQSQQEGNLMLTDITGRVILQASTPLNYQKAIDISMLAKGVYLLRFSSNDGAVETVKVVKE